MRKNKKERSKAFPKQSFRLEPLLYNLSQNILHQVHHLRILSPFNFLAILLYKVLLSSSHARRLLRLVEEVQTAAEMKEGQKGKEKRKSGGRATNADKLTTAVSGSSSGPSSATELTYRREVDSKDWRFQHNIFSVFFKSRASDEVFFPTCMQLLGMLAPLSLSVSSCSTSSSLSSSCSSSAAVAVGGTGNGAGDVAPSWSHVFKRRLTFCDWSQSAKSPFEYTAALSQDASGRGVGEDRRKREAVRKVMADVKQAKAEGCVFFRKIKMPSSSSSSSPCSDGKKLSSRERFFCDWSAVLYPCRATSLVTAPSDFCHIERFQRVVGSESGLMRFLVHVDLNRTIALCDEHESEVYDGDGDGKDSNATNIATTSSNSRQICTIRSDSDDHNDHSSNRSGGGSSYSGGGGGSSSIISSSSSSSGCGIKRKFDAVVP